MRDRARERKVARQVAKHPQHVLYTVWALWLIGFSESFIGRAVAKTRKQVSGIVSRSPYQNRSAMTRPERQDALETLLKIRWDDQGRPLDRGLLDRVPRQVRELAPRQLKRRVR